MDFDTLVALPDSEKVFLAKVNIKDQVDDETWTQCGSPNTNAWYLDYVLGSVNKVEEDGSEYTERFLITECHSNASSFYYDFDNQRLYIHTSGSDDPAGASNYTILAYIWQNFTDKQYTDEPNIYSRITDVLTNGGFEIWASSTDASDWTETIAGSSTITREATTIYDGGYSLKITVDAVPNAAYETQSIILKPRARCKLAFYYQNSAATKIGKIALYDSASNVSLNSSGAWIAGVSDISLPSVTEWTSYELEFYVHSDYTNYNIRFKGDDASTSVYYDKATLDLYREDNFYHPFFDSKSLSPITQAVSDYYTGGVTTQFGSLKFLDDGWWFPMLDAYIWYNCETKVKLGAKGSDYEDFETIFSGRTQEKSIDISKSKIKIDTIDERALIFREVPVYRFWTTDFANLDPDAEGKVRPLLYGQKENITPTQINTSTYQYEIAQHAIESIDAAYKDGTTLTGGGTDYTEDLANGRFTLTADPGDALITCDAKGKKCDFEDSTYSTNIADIIWDILINVTGISQDKIDFDSLRNLKSGRTQAHCLYLNYAINAFNLIRMFQASALFHFTPLLNGKFGFFRFTSDYEGAPTFYDYDYDYFQIDWLSSVFKKINLKYDRDPTEDKWNITQASEDGVGYKYSREETLTIETTLKSKAEADVLAGWYLDALENPPKKIKTKISTIGFNMRPAQKIIVNKTRKDADGDEITICDSEVYTILGLRKELKTGRVGLIAQDTSQITELGHADEHADVEHEDSHTDTHGDGAHTDTPHVDSHDDTAHVDTHSDTAHEDAHSDVHEDYYDEVYSDVHLDTHDDTAHVDTHGDTAHEDFHDDTAYGDSAHEDTHTDEHADVPHEDSHSDS